jgi:beta-phosphoglucomutase-like phosphatase (HAD superfamily)
MAGARCVGVEPAQAAVFEDALAGVAAGRAGGFGFVVGVDRIGEADALKEHGADIVVSDLADLLDGASVRTPR